MFAAGSITAAAPSLALRPCPHRSALPCSRWCSPLSGGAQAQAPKTLRVAFPIAENGFDPQAIYDEYSAKVCNAIFDPLYTYDYFARPAKLVPNTAEGLPQITDGGRTFTVKVRPGIYFASHPAFGGKQARADRARLRLQHQADFRSEDPVVLPLRVREPAGRARSAARAGAKERQVRLRRADRGPEGARQVHAADPDEGPRLLDSALARDDHDSRGREGGRRRERRCVRSRDGRSGRHRSVQARGMAPQPAHRARGESRLPRRALSRAARRQFRGGCRDREGPGGTQAAARAACRDLDHRGIAAAAARVPQRRISITSTCRRRSRQPCSTATS